MAYVSGWVEGGCRSVTLRRRPSAHDGTLRGQLNWFDQRFPAIGNWLEARGNTFAMQSNAKLRRDVVASHGPQSETWGFEARCLLPTFTHMFGHYHLIVQNAAGVTQTLDVTKIMLERVVADHARPNEFFEKCRSTPGARVLEIGARARSGIVRKQLFGEGALYTGVDIMEGENVDVVADVHFLSQSISGPFDFVYSASVFEHLLMPWKVVSELNKVMAPGGLILTQAPQTWPLHDEPWDFFRFSALAWKSLFNELSGFEIEYVGNSDEAICLPVHNCGHLVLHLSDQRCYLGSYCIARKVGETREFDVPRDAYERILGSDKYPV